MGSKSKMRFVRFNRIFTTFCASWASLNTEFALTTSFPLKIIDKITLVWSCIILATNITKWFLHPLHPVGTVLIISAPDGESTAPNPAAVEFPTIRDIVLINYLPLINDFGRLYYGLLSVSVGAPLVWRVYLNFYRPSRFGRLYSTRETRRNLVQFFIDGDYNKPGRKIGMSSVATILAKWTAAIEDEKTPDAEDRHEGRSPTDSKGKPRVAKNVNHLSKSHYGPDRNACRHIQAYSNPVREHNFLEEYTEARWNLLARHMYTMIVFILTTTAPILYFLVHGLKAVMDYFAIAGADGWWLRSLYIYGALEQAYTCTQSALFFMFTNLFITLFHADLIFKSKPLTAELEALNRLYSDRYKSSVVQSTYMKPPIADSWPKATWTKTPARFPLSREDIHKQQLRIWAYFDNIVQLDCFVSNYSQISLFTFILGLLFGQSYMKIEDESLRGGTAACLVTNFLSFTYLYVVSWDIEQRSSKFHKILLSIVARDTDCVTRRIWLKTLTFFESDFNRTFTMGSRYSLNLQSFSKTMFGSLTMSFLIHRLFHKHSWEKSLA